MPIDNNSNRPSAAQEAARADQKKIPLRDARGVQSNQPGSKAGKSKESASLFDALLDSATGSSGVHESGDQNPNAFDSRLKGAKEQESRREDSSESRRDDDKKSSSSDSNSSKTQRESSTGILKDRVLAKQGRDGGSQGGGTQGGGKGQDQSGSRHSGGASQKEISGVKKIEPGSLLAQAGMQPLTKPPSSFANQLNTAQSQVPREIPKQILDQMVQRIVIGLNKNMQKELRVDLSDQIFKGLSVKVTSQSGKVDVTFIASNADVRRLFEANKQSISQALEEKNIRVGSMQVQWIGA